jgi:hypothetical protein
MVERHPPPFNAETLEDIEITTTARLIKHGRQYHLSLRGVDVEFWGLKAKDRILFRLLKVKRAKPGM